MVNQTGGARVSFSDDVPPQRGKIRQKVVFLIKKLMSSIHLLWRRVTWKVLKCMTLNMNV